MLEKKVRANVRSQMTAKSESKKMLEKKVRAKSESKREIKNESKKWEQKNVRKKWEHSPILTETLRNHNFAANTIDTKKEKFEKTEKKSYFWWYLFFIRKFQSLTKIFIFFSTKNTQKTTRWQFLPTFLGKHFLKLL